MSLPEARKQNESITMVWTVTPECPGNFSDCFEPIEGVEMVSQLICENQEWRKLPEEAYQCLRDNLKPKPFVMEIVNGWKQKLGNDYVALHVRRTDYIAHAQRFGGAPAMTEYYNLAKPFSSEPLFLATDNRWTQCEFEKVYGDRVHFIPIVPSENLRQTSLLNAVVDLYICVGAKHFIGSPWSSFTRVISELRKNL